jgi:predicted secreted acid phosphatase
MIYAIDSYVQAKAKAIEAMRDALKRYPNQQLAAMIDIDGTLLMDTPNGQYKENGTVYLKPIRSIVDVATWAHLHQIKVVIITARPNTKSTVLWTRKNLARAGVHYDQLLFLKPSDDPSKFKPIVKKSLSSLFGYKFVVSIGDAKVDVIGGYNVSGVAIKLRSRYD